MPDQPTDPTDQPADQAADQPADLPSDAIDQPTDATSQWSDATDQPTDHPEKSGPRPMGDTIRSKLEEYEVERHLEELAHQVESVVRQGIEAVGTYAHDHRRDIDDWLSRAAENLDRRTSGRHADKIQEVRGQLERGVQRIAERRPDGDPGGSETPGSEES
ncbi:MAG: hypothetical protein J2P22_08215 [Nocardioides sp.]|nr:hypothetical protein [Nocardioides sp.]